MRILSYSLLCLTLLTGLGLPVLGRDNSYPSTATDGNSGGQMETELNKGKPVDMYDDFDESSGRSHGQEHDSTYRSLRRSRSGQKNKIRKSATFRSVVNGIDIGSKSKKRNTEKNSDKSPQSSRRTSSIASKKKKLPRDMIAALLRAGNEDMDMGKYTKSPKKMVTKLILKGKGKKYGKGTKAPKQSKKSTKSQKTQQPSVSPFPTRSPTEPKYVKILLDYCASFCEANEKEREKITKSIKKRITDYYDDVDKKHIKEVIYEFEHKDGNCPDCKVPQEARLLKKDQEELKQNTVFITIEFENDPEGEIPDPNTIANILNNNIQEIEDDLNEFDLTINSIDVASTAPSLSPTDLPSLYPSSSPTSQPSKLPSTKPSLFPSLTPSSQPSKFPSALPSSFPSSQPSISQLPSVVPSLSFEPSMSDHPSLQPSTSPSSTPSTTSEPSLQPSSEPSLQPSSGPSSVPSRVPSFQPSDLPSSQPSVSLMPSFDPTGTDLRAIVVCRVCASECFNSTGADLSPDQKNVFNDEMRNTGLGGVLSESILVLNTNVANNECTPCQNTQRRFLQEENQIQSTIVIEVVVDQNGTVSLPDPLNVTQNMQDALESLNQNLAEFNLTVVEIEHSSEAPSTLPTSMPSLEPSLIPSDIPSLFPSIDPSLVPSGK